MKLLVFLHGLGQMPQTWQDQVTRMRSDRFRAVAPWIKGLRPGRLSPFSVDEAADDLLSLLNTNGVESMAVVASGLGSVVTLAAAERYPAGISDMVLEDVSVKYGRLALGTQRTMIKAMPEAKWAATGLNKSVVLDVLDGLSGIDLTTDLDKVTARTLVVVGQRDRVQKAAAEVVVDGVRGAQLSVIPDASEPVHLTNPEAFNTAMWDFIDPAMPDLDFGDLPGSDADQL